MAAIARKLQSFPATTPYHLSKGVGVHVAVGSHGRHPFCRYQNRLTSSEVRRAVVATGCLHIRLTVSVRLGQSCRSSGESGLVNSRAARLFISDPV